MSEDINQDKKSAYRNMINSMGKKEFTLLKMQEYGFWPKDLPTPYQKKKNETLEQFEHRKELLNDYTKLVNQIAKLYETNDEINQKIRDLKKSYDETWDYEKIRQDISKKLMEESIARRAERKRQRELASAQKTLEWQNKKANEILFIGKGYSGLLHDKASNDDRLIKQGLPVIKTDKELSRFLCIEYKELRFLTYHRDVVIKDHYHRYTMAKKSGGVRNIAAPKSILKSSQAKILEGILYKLEPSQKAHGFLPGKSVITGASEHIKTPDLVINIDLKDFFPTITFERVRGMFKSFGYSGYIASLMAMLCTYCERMPIEVRGITKFVKTTNRILPQGSPASPMITNILCKALDKRLAGLASKNGLVYTRYADDMSFSLKKPDGYKYKSLEDGGFKAGSFLGLVSKIVKDEGFIVNKEKTRFLRKNNRQEITGIVINNGELAIPKKWIKKLRAAIYNTNKLKKSGKVPFERINEIHGMASWAKSVNAEKYRTIVSKAFDLKHE